MSDNGTVDITVHAAVGTIHFSHPRGNSMPGALLREVAGAVDRLAADANVRVLLLRSAGERTFCAGASFDELLAVQTTDQSKHFFSGFATLILAMRRCPKFIVTRVQGKCVGGGVGIVAASDYVLAHTSASIRLSELALGFGPFIIGPAVQRKVGIGAFSELAIGADWREASWAKHHNLYSELFEGHSELDGRVAQFLKRLAGFNPDAMAKLKSVLWEGTEHWEQLLDSRANITSRLALTPFVQETIRAINP